jgi:hypothetical protein
VARMYRWDCAISCVRAYRVQTVIRYRGFVRLKTTTLSTRNCNVPTGSRVSKDSTEPAIRFGRGRREAVTTTVKVAGVSTSDIKAKEQDGPLAGRASVVGGAVPTAGAAAAESGIGGGKESEKSSRTSSAGNECLGIGRVTTMGISVKRGSGIMRVRASQRGSGDLKGRQRQDGRARRRSMF